MGAKTKLAWCVYATYQHDGSGQTYAFGDGVTASTRRLYALCDTREQAEAEMARLNAALGRKRPLMPGDGRMRPELDVTEYDPLDFVGRQNRDEYTGKRYAALCGSLAEHAKRNAAQLLG